MDPSRCLQPIDGNRPHQGHSMQPQPNLKPFDEAETLRKNSIVQGRIRLEDGEYQSKSFVIGDELGKGAFAKCVACSDLETQKLMAMKVVSKTSLERSRTKQKVLIIYDSF